jgi:hypothetical protein
LFRNIIEVVKNNADKGQAGKLDDMHSELQEWRSNMQFVADEIHFIDRMLNSYIFEPNTPNLFERLQDYERRLKSLKSRKETIEDRIARHENDLGGIIECKDKTCDTEYYRKHDDLKASFTACLEEFKVLKSEIFNYAGGILKKRKPIP